MEYGCLQATVCKYPHSIQIMGYAYGRENLFIYLDIFCPVLLYPVNKNRFGFAETLKTYASSLFFTVL